MEGTVKWFNTRKGYGFITGDDGEEYFVHYSAVPQGVFLRDNDKVSFEAADTDRGKQAQKVELLQKGSERTDVEAEEAPAEGEASTEEAPAEEEAPTEEASAEEEVPVDKDKESEDF